MQVAGDTEGNPERRREQYAYQRVVEIGVNTPEIWASYGDSCKKLGQYDDADEAYTRSLEIRPDDPEVWLKRAKVQASKNNYNDALASCDKSLEFDNTAVQTWHYKAFILKKARRNEDHEGGDSMSAALPFRLQPQRGDIR